MFVHEEEHLEPTLPCPHPFLSCTFLRRRRRGIKRRLSSIDEPLKQAPHPREIRGPGPLPAARGGGREPGEPGPVGGGSGRDLSARTRFAVVVTVMGIMVVVSCGGGD